MAQNVGEPLHLIGLYGKKYLQFSVTHDKIVPDIAKGKEGVQ